MRYRAVSAESYILAVRSHIPRKVQLIPGYIRKLTANTNRGSEVGQSRSITPVTNKKTYQSGTSPSLPPVISYQVMWSNTMCISLASRRDPATFCLQSTWHARGRICGTRSTVRRCRFRQGLTGVQVSRCPGVPEPYQTGLLCIQNQCRNH